MMAEVVRADTCSNQLIVVQYGDSYSETTSALQYPTFAHSLSKSQYVEACLGEACYCIRFGKDR